MKTLFNYINKYGNTSFSEKEFNAIDASILSMLSYLDFDGIVSSKREYVRLDYAILEFLRKVNKRKFCKDGFGNRDCLKLANSIIEKKRYKNILLYNYVFKVTFEEQFCAVSMKLNDDSIFISYEGTDSNLVGWEEDFAIGYKFPVPAQKDAIKYLNRTISFNDKNVYVGGHSKGGHLAQVASMYANIFNRNKIKQIYSIDGPGVRKREIESKRYKRIEDRFNHIVSKNTFFGLLYRHTDNYRVVNTNSFDFNAHLPFYWEVDDDDFVDAKLSKFSKKFDKSIIDWLDLHDDDMRKQLTKEIFDIFRNLNITTVPQARQLYNILRIIRETNNLDVSTKDILVNFVSFNIKNIIDDNKDS